MSFDNNEIEMCLSNMRANEELYTKIAEAEELQGSGCEYIVACAQQCAWSEAADQLEEAYRKLLRMNAYKKGAKICLSK